MDINAGKWKLRERERERQDSRFVKFVKFLLHYGLIFSHIVNLV